MMTLEAFADKSDLNSLTEVEKACYLAFFFLKTEDFQEFNLTDVSFWLEKLHLSRPNSSRLSTKLNACANALRGSSRNSFKLHRAFIQELTGKYPELERKSQTVVDDGAILPHILYDTLPGYLQSLAKQINASYEHNIFDGCAVLMRRLEEVLLILSYEKLGIASLIKDSNSNYLMLESIVKNASNNPQLNLSRNSKKSIEPFRELGNYSAHKITYTCKREYIAERINEYRALIDELLHKAALKT